MVDSGAVGGSVWGRGYRQKMNGRIGLFCMPALILWAEITSIVLYNTEYGNNYLCYYVFFIFINLIYIWVNLWLYVYCSVLLRISSLIIGIDFFPVNLKHFADKMYLKVNVKYFGSNIFQSNLFL